MSKRKPIKTKEESIQYKKAVKSSQGYSSTTDENHFFSLQGSNEEHFNEPQDHSCEKARGLATAKIKTFLKKHIFEEVISAILAIFVAVASWAISSLIYFREKIAAFEVRVEVAQERLDEIENDYISKEFLSQELEILRLKLESAQKDELSSIETRLALIENEIEYIFEQSKKASSD